MNTSSLILGCSYLTLHWVDILVGVFRERQRQSRTKLPVSLEKEPSCVALTRSEVLLARVIWQRGFSYHSCFDRKQTCLNIIGKVPNELWHFSWTSVVYVWFLIKQTPSWGMRYELFNSLAMSDRWTICRTSEWWNDLARGERKKTSSEEKVLQEFRRN